jgi:hypothetical protein
MGESLRGELFVAQINPRHDGHILPSERGSQ